jgi:endo-1,4-beta-D-glucanase Y
MARHRWLIPVNLAIQKAEIRRIAVQGQLRQTVHQNLSGKYLVDGVAQLVKHLPSKSEVLSSNSSYIYIHIYIYIYKIGEPKTISLSVIKTARQEISNNIGDLDNPINQLDMVGI